MRRLLSCLFPVAALAIAAPAWAASTTANFNIGVTQSQAIASLSLSNNSFTGGSASGTVVGAISVVMAPATPAFSGTLSLTGANASNFQIVGANLESNGVVPAGTYQINIVATQAGATGSPFVKAETITGTATTASTCPHGTAYPADGCSGAQTTGVVRISNFFTGYTGTNYPTRPPWNVAGVDYPVGYAGTPVNATTATLPACLTFNGSSFAMTATSSDCTVNGFNFEGYCLNINAAPGYTATLTNSYVWGSLAHCNPSGGTLVHLSGNGNFVLKYDEFDGNQTYTGAVCSGGCPANMIFYPQGSTGNLTVQYSYFPTTNQADIDFENTSPGVFTAEFNYIETVGLAPSHGDWIISNQSQPTAVEKLVEDHNTGYASTLNGHTSNATSFCYITNWDGSTAQISGGCSYDTWVIGVGVSTAIEVNPGGIVNAINTSYNYIDYRGGDFAFYMPTQAGSVFNGPATCVSNINLATGAGITGTMSTFGAGWVCH